MKQYKLLKQVVQHSPIFLLGLSISANALAAESTGLWFGMVEVTHVNQVHGELTEGEGDEKKVMTECIPYPAESTAPCDPVSMPQPIPQSFQLQMLLHVDQSGAVKLLREAYIMQTKERTDKPIQRVVISDERKLKDYDGIIRRDGKLVGVRLASTSFPFDVAQSSQPVTGALSNTGNLSMTLLQAKDHPTNPFRHQYHPMHGEGVDVTRKVTVNFRAPDENDNKVNPNRGKNTLRGEYLETLKGLHKSDLKVAGNIILTQVNQISVIDDAEALPATPASNTASGGVTK